MYSVTYDGVLIYQSGMGALPAYDLHLSEAENSPAEFSFQLPAIHPLTGKIEAGRAEIVVYESRGEALSEEHEIFRGKIVRTETDFQNGKQVECAGTMAYLENSIQRPFTYQNKTVSGFLSELLEEHNRQVSSEEKIYPGTVTVSGSLSGRTDYAATLECMRGRLLKEFGGRLVIRRQDEKNYLDYLSEYGHSGGQPVEFGRNLLDFSKNMDISGVYTVCIPLGARQENNSDEGVNTYLTIESVNGGKDFVENQEAAALYGRRAKAVFWKDVTSPEELKRRGEQWLVSNQYENLSLEVSAVDLSMAGEEFEDFRLGDETLLYSKPHGLNRRFPITKRDRYLDDPEKNTITLGKDIVKGIVGSIHSVNEETEVQFSRLLPLDRLLALAKENAQALIEAALNGYVVTSPDEILIMDAPKKETANKVWRWNRDGLGYSRTGCEGPYKTVMTMDGEIVADFIRAGTLNADRIEGGTIEGDVIASNLTLQGGRVNIDAVSENGYPNVIKLSQKYTSFTDYTTIAPGEVEVRSTNTGDRCIRILSDEIEFRTKEGGTYIGFNDAYRIQNLRFGTKVLIANGTSTSIPVLTQTDLNGMFGGTGFSGSNTMVSFANGDGRAQNVHVDGAMFKDNAWCATFYTAPAAGPIRINYMVSYFG